LLPATVLKEELFWNNLVGVLSSEVDVSKILLTVQRGADTFGGQTDFKVNSIVDDDVEGVLEFLDFISVAHYVNHFVFVWLEDTVSLHDLPDAFFVLCKGSVLCVNLRLITNFDFFGVISEHFDIVVVNFTAVDRYDWANRHSDDCKHDRYGLALKFDKQWNADTVQDLCLQTYLHDLCGVGLDDTALDVGFVGCNALALVILGHNFKFGF